MFVILEDRYGRLSSAPQNWVRVCHDNKEIVYWPKSNLTILLNNASSEPVTEGENKWLIVSDTIKRRGLPTKNAAEAEIERMMQYSGTDEDNDKIININRRNNNKFLTKAAAKHRNADIPQFDVTGLSRPALSSALKINLLSNSPKTPTGSPVSHLPTTPNSVSFHLPTTPNSSRILPTLSPLILSTSQLTDIDGMIPSIFHNDLFDVNNQLFESNMVTIILLCIVCRYH